MRPDTIIHVIWLLAGLVGVNFVYRAIRNRGLKGAIFGAPIKRTVGELDLGKSGPISTTLKFHSLESQAPGAPTVVIELVTRSAINYHTWPIRLTTGQAAALKELLSQAMADNPR